MSSFCTLATVCFQLAYGFTMVEAPKSERTLVVASYHPVKGCNGNVEGMEFGSACRTVPKARDPFRVQCPDGTMKCRANFSAKHTNWPEHRLPSITVNAPKSRAKKALQNGSKGSGVQTTQANQGSVPQSIATQAAEQIIRQGHVMGSQMAGAAAGFAVGGPAGALVGGWIGCSSAVQMQLEIDFAAKERWDLHPEIRAANIRHTAIGCSLVGFLQRAKEASTDRDRIFALAGGLSLVPVPMVSLVGQLAPAGNALLHNAEYLSKGAGNAGLFGKSRPPYHDGEPWAATTP